MSDKKRISSFRRVVPMIYAYQMLRIVVWAAQYMVSLF